MAAEEERGKLYNMRTKGRPTVWAVPHTLYKSSLHVTDTLTEHIFTGALEQMNHHFSLRTLVFCKLYTFFFKLHFSKVGSQMQVFM